MLRIAIVAPNRRLLSVQAMPWDELQPFVFVPHLRNALDYFAAERDGEPLVSIDHRAMRAGVVWIQGHKYVAAYALSLDPNPAEPCEEELAEYRRGYAPVRGWG